MNTINGATISSAPATEPVTLAELRSFLRIGTGNPEPAPTSPTVALAVPDAPGNVDNGAHRYKVTFVTADGETEGGEASAAVTVADKTVNGQVSLTAIPLGGSLVTSRKLYRTVAAGSTYKFLATLSNNTATTYTDNIADSALGADAPSTNTTIDPLLTTILKSARAHVEEITGRKLVTQTWDFFYNCFPDGYGFQIPYPPLQSVSEFVYVDSAGADVAVTAASYQADAKHEPGRVLLASGYSWPGVTLRPANGVRIRAVVGYGAASAVPEGIKTIIKQVASWLWLNPGEDPPKGLFRMLAAPYRVEYEP